MTDPKSDDSDPRDNWEPDPAQGPHRPFYVLRKNRSGANDATTSADARSYEKAVELAKVWRERHPADDVWVWATDRKKAVWPGKSR